MLKTQMIETIRRRLGHPVIKIELDDSQIIDTILEARNKWVKWAVGQSKQETFFTILLSAGQSFYDMPLGVLEIVDYTYDTGLGSINTLFTLDNYLFMNGYYQGLFNTGGDGYTLVSYQIARDFLETVQKYQVDAYNFKYHKYTNQLEIQPSPKSGNYLSIDILDENGQVTETQVVDSPGFILIRSYMLEGSTVPTFNPVINDENFYGEDWIIDYSFALSMRTLGYIRRKFANFTSLGNSGISLDGDQLISEANSLIEKLDEKLRKEELSEAFGIIIG